MKSALNENLAVVPDDWRIGETWNAPTYLEANTAYWHNGHQSIRMEKGTDATKSREILCADKTQNDWSIRVKPGDHIVFKVWMKTAASTIGDTTPGSGIRLGIDFYDGTGSITGIQSPDGSPPTLNGNNVVFPANQYLNYVNWGHDWEQRTMEFVVANQYAKLPWSTATGATGAMLTPDRMIPWVQVWSDTNGNADNGIAWFADAELYINPSNVPVVLKGVGDFQHYDGLVTQASVNFIVSKGANTVSKQLYLDDWSNPSLKSQWINFANWAHSAGLKFVVTCAEITKSSDSKYNAVYDSATKNQWINGFVAIIRDTNADGVCLMNEPRYNIAVTDLKQFYIDFADAVHAVLPSCFFIVEGAWDGTCWNIATLLNPKLENTRPAYAWYYSAHYYYSIYQAPTMNDPEMYYYWNNDVANATPALTTRLLNTYGVQAGLNAGVKMVFDEWGTLITNPNAAKFCQDFFDFCRSKNVGCLQYGWWIPSGTGFDYSKSGLISSYAPTLNALGDVWASNMSAAPTPVLTYPTDRWQRLWSKLDGTYLGETPDESAVQFDNNWGSGVLAYGLSDYIQFSSSRTINMPATGNYVFTVGSDDGVRLWIDDVLVLDKWADRSYAVDTFTVNLAQGDHRFRLDFYENAGDAQVSFSYTPPMGVGTLNVTATAGGSPINASVSVNGTTGTTPATFQLAAGTYTVTATYQGTTLPAQTITITAGQTTTIELQFTAPLLTLPFYENFANLDRWIVGAGTWTVANNTLTGTAPADSLGIIYTGAGSESWTDYEVSADVVIVQTVKEASLALRVRDNINYYFIGIGMWGHQYSIAKVVNDTHTEIIGIGSSADLVYGQTYKVKAVAIGSLLQLWVDGSKVLETTDASLASGAVGCRIWGSVAQYRNFQAVVPAAYYNITIDSAPIKGITIALTEVN